jgi:ribosomal protein S18 acetylase RimI-like enzyme
VNIALRNFTPTDLPQLEDWVLRGDLAHFMSRWTPRSFQKGQWDRQLAHWWIIVADDSDVGTLWIERTAVGDTVADLGVLIGVPATRGIGIGRTAIRLAETEGNVAWGIETVRLGVRQNNERAIRCYTKAGYVVSKVFDKIVAGGERIAAMEMTRKLIKP